MFRVGITNAKRFVSATVFDLPGCVAEAPERLQLIETLPICIAEYLAWLTKHGEAMPQEAAPQFAIVEEVTPKDSDAADGEFCFQNDQEPASAADIETAVRFLGYAREDLERITASLPDALLDWRPPLSAMAKVDPWKPSVLTIREIVADIANAEGYYRGGLQDGKEEAGDDSPGLDAQRALTLERLRDLTDHERSKLFRPQRPWQDKQEHWTARKVLRRMISHERFHTAEIRQRLSWILLGVPDFGGDLH